MEQSRESSTTTIARNVAFLVNRVIDKMQQELAPGVGRESVGNRLVRKRVRQIEEDYLRALVGNDEGAEEAKEAMVEVVGWARQSGHSADGDNCLLCRQVAEVLAKGVRK